MAEPPGFDPPALLTNALGGDDDALDQLWLLLYGELRELAARMIGRGGQGVLQPTAVVHEAYLKLMGAAQLDWRTRSHFYAIAGRAMRQVLCDESRERGRAKRGGGWRRVSLLSGIDDRDEQPEFEVDPTALSDALDQLRERDERAATIVVLRFFSGLTTDEIAEVLGVTSRTIRNDWHMARAWLHRQVFQSDGGS